MLDELLSTPVEKGIATGQIGTTLNGFNGRKRSIPYHPSVDFVSLLPAGSEENPSFGSPTRS